MALKIVIPSYKRPEKVVAKNLVTDPILCVSESEYEAYKEYNPECEIITHPDSVKGLPAKRNWMVNHFKELFMLDDDVVGFQPQFYPPGISTAYIKNPEQIRKIVEKLYTISKMLNISLFGFSKNQRVQFYKPNKPYVLNTRVTGCAYGVIKSPHTIWPKDLKLKEDFWISGYVKYYERLILVDTRYEFEQKGTMISPGGLAEYRNLETEKEAMLYIKKSFGDCVTLQRENKLVRNVSKINITISFPF